MMTKQEEKDAIAKLIKEADDRGFKKGTLYRQTWPGRDGVFRTNENCAAHRAEHFYTYPDKRGITLYCGMSQGCIYAYGEWAEIYGHIDDQDVGN